MSAPLAWSPTGAPLPSSTPTEAEEPAPTAYPAVLVSQQSVYVRTCVRACLRASEQAGESEQANLRRRQRPQRNTLRGHILRMPYL